MPRSLTSAASLAAMLGAVVLLPACFNPSNTVEISDSGEDGSSSGAIEDGSDDGEQGTDGTGGDGSDDGIGSTGADDSTGADIDDPCGNGIVEDGEQCDLGTGNSENGMCTLSCELATCGDGLLQLGVEDCDDGGETETCNADCSAASCGDGVLNETAGESCDDAGDSEFCNADCSPATCGDGYVNTLAGEQCEGEDGTNSSCNDACVFECNAGFGDCNADVTGDGCETPLDTLANCGQCGNACEGFPLCGENGGCARYVFITSARYGANLGGLDGADAICQQHANDAGLPGTYRAWLSDSATGPLDRFTSEGGPWVRVDGAVVANDWADLLDGSLYNTIDVNELGGPPPASASQCGSEAVWTNTRDDGTVMGPSSSCDNWTSTDSPSSGWGNFNRADAWSLQCSGGTTGCSSEAPLYCFQQ